MSDLIARLDSLTLRTCRQVPSVVLATCRGAATALRAAEHQRDGYRWHLTECEQIAGKALGYPWFKDDAKNFPEATEADGVCIGEHVGDTIVQELADKLRTAEARVATLGGQTAEAREVVTRLVGVVERRGHVEATTIDNCPLCRELKLTRAFLAKLEGETP